MHTTFHEPMVLFGYLAAITSLELVTQGRFRLGVGIGWNAVEYEALAKDFSNRGRRIEEQISLLRRLWTEQSVTFEGDFERITGAGLAPLPIQRPIPVWLGAESPRGYKGAGRLADGWFPQMSPGPKLYEARALVDKAAREARRDPSTLGMEGRVSWNGESTDLLAEVVGQWRDAGATHLGINTMGARLGGVASHLAVLARAAEALGLATSG